MISSRPMAVLLTAATLGTGLLPSAMAATFGDDVAFLRKHTEVIVLHDEAGASQITVVPAWQGRVMTSTAAGVSGRSFGWINRDLIASRRFQEHINVFGGEDRFWLGPEGGQFSIFFAKGATFDLDHWFVPAALDTLPFKIIRQSSASIEFHAAFALTNYSGTRFQVEVNREVQLIEGAEALKAFGVASATGVSLVAYESRNTLINAGKQAWKKETGLLSIWILGMFNPSPSATIVVPIRASADGKLGPRVTSDYFGAVPADRLKVTQNAIFFSGDGKFRSKIGVGPRSAKGIIGSYDPDSQTLTLVQFDQPEGVTDYVNSLWKIQEDPFSGDALNSYNDGPPSPGAKPLGPFYELESSSPAAALTSGGRLMHTHRTLHLTGPESALEPIARKALGVSLSDVRSAFQSVAPCDRSDPAFVCDLTNAEDLFRLPGTPWVIVSHINFDFSTSPPRPAGLGPVEIVRIDTRQVQRLYPRPDSAVDWDRKMYPDCSAPPENIALAGLNARPLGKNRFRLYLTNHGGRQSVEIVDLAIEGEKLRTTWRGCVRAPEYVWPNSVAPLPGDGFVLSGKQAACWKPGQGWTKVEGYVAEYSNGVEVSRDGKWIFIANAGRVLRIPVAGGTAESVRAPADNLRWGEDGYLYVVNRTSTKSLHPFAVTQIDSNALTAKEVFRTSDEGIEGFGNSVATTALQVEGQFWIGTVRGDRVAIVPKTP